MNKIGADHLARRAYVYIRQSTLDQVQNNRESQRRQYALADRARELGWADVEVIDDDLGRSGSGTKRPGFERMLLDCVAAGSERCSALRLRAWRAMVATGILCSSSAVSWGPC